MICKKSKNEILQLSLKQEFGILFAIFWLKEWRLLPLRYLQGFFSPEELGSFTNFTSWINILLVLTSFDLSQSIIRSKMDFEGDIDSYIWSILSFSTICTLIIYAIVCIFHGFFEQILSMEMKYIHVMFMYLIVFPAYQMLITKHRAYYRYKLFAILTAIMVISSVLLSLVMVFLLENKPTGRIVGYYLPYILFGAGIYIVLACKGKKIKIQYWKYASVICIPLSSTCAVDAPVEFFWENNAYFLPWRSIYGGFQHCI